MWDKLATWGQTPASAQRSEAPQSEESLDTLNVLRSSARVEQTSLRSQAEFL
jgi:hypothetical protein